MTEEPPLTRRGLALYFITLVIVSMLASLLTLLTFETLRGSRPTPPPVQVRGTTTVH